MYQEGKKVEAFGWMIKHILAYVLTLGYYNYIFYNH